MVRITGKEEELFDGEIEMEGLYIKALAHSRKKRTHSLLVYL
jgi:hypothetical protein